MNPDDERKPAIGRPSSFTEEIAATICAKLADGESLRAICRDEAMPDKATVFRWLAANEAFRDQYACAREFQADTFVDEIPDIADDSSNDFIKKTEADGKTADTFNAEHVQRARLRIDARKWVAGKLRPKKYGDKLDVEHAGKLAVVHLSSADADL